jgi:hypothetical protein
MISVDIYRTGQPGMQREELFCEGTGFPGADAVFAEAGWDSIFVPVPSSSPRIARIIFRGLSGNI